jgi:hypothetical protein
MAEPMWPSPINPIFIFISVIPVVRIFAGVP